LRVLFDYFYPGVIPGTVFEIPEWLDFDAHVVPAVTLAISTNPAPAIEMAGVEQLEIQYASIPELIGSILSGLYYNIVGTEDLLGRTHGRVMVGNIDTEYTGSSDDDALNAGVQRYEATPDAANYLEHWYQPSGKLASSTRPPMRVWSRPREDPTCCCSCPWTRSATAHSRFQSR
jgi:hypothetical protein